MEKFDVVISGVSGRFPDCDDVDTFKEKLYKSEDFISFDERKWKSTYTFEKGRQNIPHGTGKFCYVSEFDSVVFKLNTLFARSKDIISRKTFEPVFESIVDAGINPYSLAGQNVGVFVTCGINEVECAPRANDGKIISILGLAKGMMANRISFSLDINGPSFTYQENVFGSIEALVTAFESIANGYVDAAIVGVCSSIVQPAMSLSYKNMNLLSADASTRVFSKDASGFGRSEACVVYFMQRAEDAKRIYAKINICETYFSGLKPGTLLQYDEKYLETFYKKIYQNNMVPEDLGFLETSACGIKELDSIELNIVNKFFCKNRKTSLLIGSVKSNIGHTEGAAPYVSLLKALFALETNLIAPNINIGELDPELTPLQKGKLQIVSKPTSLAGDKVGIDSVSLAGTVGHIVLQRVKTKRCDTPFDNLPRLLLLCGRTEKALLSAIEKIESIPFNPEFIALANDVFSSDMPIHLYRGYTILPKQFNAKHDIQIKNEIKYRPIWYLFTGMGCQWNCMGHELLDLPIFAEVVEKCDRVLKPHGIDIYEVLTSDDSAIFDNIVNSFVGINTIQIGLTEVLKAVGLKPDGIIGHSTGENACAYADGCLTIEQSVMASYVRGVSSTKIKTVKGMMAAVGIGYENLKNSLPANVEIACHNSPDSSTISGPASDVESFVADLKKRNIFAKSVNVANIAFHSKNIAPVAPELLARLKKIITCPKQRSSKWISTSVPEAEWDKPLAQHCSAEYLTNNLLNPVLFEEGCKHIPNNAIVIEIAPHGLLQALVRKSLPKTCTNITLIRRSKTKNNLKCLLSSIGSLYIAGCVPKVNALYPTISYPVSSGTPFISPYCTWDRSAANISSSWFKPLPMKTFWEDLIHVSVNDDAEYSYLRHHKVNGEIIIPPGFFIYIAWWAKSFLENKKFKYVPVLFEDVKIHRMVKISLKKPKSFSVMMLSSGSFEILYKKILIINGRVSSQVEQTHFMKNTDIINFPTESKIKLQSDKFYNYLKNFGYNLDDCFSPVQEVFADKSDYYGKIRWCHNWVAFLDSLMKLHIFSHMQSNEGLFYTSFIRKLFIHAPDKLSNSKDSVVCHFSAKEKILRCCGVTILGLENKLFHKNSTLNKTRRMKIQGYNFVEYSDPQCQNASDFLGACLQIITEMHNQLYIADNAHPLLKTVTKLLNAEHNLKKQIVFCSPDEVFTEHSQIHECLFQISDFAYKEVGLNFDQQFLVLVLKASEEIPSCIEQTCVQILKQTTGNEKFYLYKKKQSKRRSTSDPEADIREKIDKEDLSIILNRAKVLNKRILYLLDHENSSTKRIHNLGRQLNLDLPIVFMKNNQLGFYKRISEEAIERNHYKKQKLQQLFDNLVVKDVKVRSICLENHFFEPNGNNERAIAYAGVHSSGKRIIGLTLINSSKPHSNIHPNFTWTITETWNLEDAAAAVSVFAQAYYILHLKGKLFRISSILINMGNEHLLTKALISVALKMNYTIFVTVSNAEEVDAIRNNFPQINNKHIFCTDQCDYDIKILQLTAKKGVNMVINCLPGLQNLTTSLNCAAVWGLVVEIGDHNCDYMNEIGMLPFLNSITFLSISKRISSLFELREEDKNVLKLAMQEGIRSSIVKPFLKDLDTLKFHERAKKLELYSFPRRWIYKKLQYGSGNSYIIIGNEKTHNSIFDFLDWLISNGACKFIVCVDEVTADTKHCNRMNELLNNENISVTMIAAQKTDSIQTAVEILSDAAKLGPLEAIFFVCMESASQRMHNMHLALKQKCQLVHFISVFSGGLIECERHRLSGFPAVVVHAENVENISSKLPLIDDILTESYNDDSPILYNIIEQPLTSEESTECIYLDGFLPKNVSEFENIGYRVTTKPTFEESCSLSLRYRESRGVYPIFIVPSIQGDGLQPLIRKLIYPVFVATLSESEGSPAELASALFMELKKIQPTGPVTLIGETWSACFTVELSKIIEQSGRKCIVLMVEGNPNKWKNQINKLGPIPSIQFDVNFLKKTLNLSQTMAETFFNFTKSFEDCVRKYFFKFSSVGINSENVIKAIVALHNRLTSAAQYKSPEQLWKNFILFSQRSSDEYPEKLSVTSNFIVVEESMYENFVQDSRIAQTINDNALFSWWDYTGVDQLPESLTY